MSKDLAHEGQQHMRSRDIIKGDVEPDEPSTMRITLIAIVLFILAVIILWLMVP